MKKLFSAIALAAIAFAGLTVTPANAAPVSTNTALAGGPYNSWVYLGKGICLLDKTGSNMWRIGDVGNTAESGTATVTTGYRTTTCSDFGDYQTIQFYLYRAPDGKCGKITQSLTPFGYQVNYSTHYVEWQKIWLNTYYDTCYNSETLRMNIVGALMGSALGIAPYTQPGVNDALMNRSYNSARGFWAKDRNNLYYKYSAR